MIFWSGVTRRPDRAWEGSWSQRSGARQRNIGWRIDYVLASPAAMKFVTGAWIESDTPGSDHAPVGVTVDRSIFG